MGTYSVVAYGKKSDGTPAARGTATVTVVAGENSVTTVTLLRLYHHTVSFFVNDTPYGTPQEITDGYTASKPTDPELAGHAFSFWAKGSPDSTTPFSFSSEITEDTDLYAVFDIETYSVTYVSEVQSVPSDSYTFETGLSALPTPTKTGYTFAGWYEDASFTTEAGTSIPAGSTGNKTFYAKWTIKVLLNTLNNGTTEKNVVYGKTVTEPTAPTQTGCTFAGWYRSSDGGTTLASTAYDFSSAVTEGFTLYAKWTVSGFTGTVDEFLSASFGTTSSKTNPYVVVLTDVTDDNIAQIGQKLLGGTMKDVYISLDLSQCTGLTIIPARAFAGCSAQWNTNSTSSNKVRGSLVSVIIPDGVTTIERSAFFQSDDLTSVTLPDSITSIGDNAFNQAGIQGTLHLPASLVTIGEGAFRYTSGITKVEAPEGLDLSNAEFSTSNIVYY